MLHTTGEGNSPFPASWQLVWEILPELELGSNQFDQKAKTHQSLATVKPAPETSKGEN